MWIPATSPTPASFPRLLPDTPEAIRAALLAESRRDERTRRDALQLLGEFEAWEAARLRLLRRATPLPGDPPGTAHAKTLVCIDGLPGAGKTTHLGKLRGALGARALSMARFAEDRGVSQSERRDHQVSTDTVHPTDLEFLDALQRESAAFVLMEKFPRTPVEAVALVDLARRNGWRLEVLHLSLPENPIAASVRRQLERGPRRGKPIVEEEARRRAMNHLARGSSGRWTLRTLGVRVHRIDTTRPLDVVHAELRRAIGADARALGFELETLRELDEVSGKLGVPAWAAAGHFYRPFWDGRFGPMQRPTDVDVAVERARDVEPLWNALDARFPQRRWSVLCPAARLFEKHGIRAATVMDAKSWSTFVHRTGVVRWTAEGVEVRLPDAAEPELWNGVVRLNPKLLDALGRDARADMLRRKSSGLRRLLESYPGLRVDAMTATLLGGSAAEHTAQPIATTWRAMKLESVRRTPAGPLGRVRSPSNEAARARETMEDRGVLAHRDQVRPFAIDSSRSSTADEWRAHVLGDPLSAVNIATDASRADAAEECRARAFGDPVESAHDASDSSRASAERERRAHVLGDPLSAVNVANDASRAGAAEECHARAFGDPVEPAPDASDSPRSSAEGEQRAHGLGDPSCDVNVAVDASRADAAEECHARAFGDPVESAHVASDSSRASAEGERRDRGLGDPLNAANVAVDASQPNAAGERRTPTLNRVRPLVANLERGRHLRRAPNDDERWIAERIVELHRRTSPSPEAPPMPSKTLLPEPLESLRRARARKKAGLEVSITDEELAATVAPPRDSASWLEFFARDTGDAQFRDWFLDQAHHHRPAGGADPWLRSILSLSALESRLKIPSRTQSPLHQGWPLERHLAAAALALETDALIAPSRAPASMAPPSTLPARMESGDEASRELRLCLRLAAMTHDLGKLVGARAPGRHGAIGAKLWRRHAPEWCPGEVRERVAWMIEAHDLFGALARGLTDKRGHPVADYAVDVREATSYVGALDVQAVRRRLHDSDLPFPVATAVAKALWRADIGSVAALRWLLPVAELIEELVLSGGG